MTTTTEDCADPIVGAHRSSRWIASIIALLWAAGVLIGTRVNIVLLLPSILVWPLLAAWWWRRLRSIERGAVADICVALAIQIGFVLTLLSLYYVVPNEMLYRNPEQFWSLTGATPYPVTAYAGFPWPGVECNPSGGAPEQSILFDMGIDALLVNLAIWSAVALLLMRLPSRSALRVLIVLVGLITPFTVVAVALQLAVLFE